MLSVTSRSVGTGVEARLHVKLMAPRNTFLDVDSASFYSHLMITRGTAPHFWELSKSAPLSLLACRRKFQSWTPEDNHSQGGLVSSVPPCGEPDLPVQSHVSIRTVS